MTRTDLIQRGNCDLGSIIVSRVEACDPSSSVIWNCNQRARSTGNRRDASKDCENAPVPLKAARSRMRPENSWQSQRTRVVIEEGDAGFVRYACRRVAALPLHGQCPHARAGALASQQVALAGCVQLNHARTLISVTARARAISVPRLRLRTISPKSRF